MTKGIQEIFDTVKGGLGELLDKDAANPRPLVFAHRGAPEDRTLDLLENTLPAFERALALGADALEFDLQLTRDDRLVVHHNDDLPDGRPIRKMDLADVRKVRLVRNGVTAPIPTFAEVVETVRKARGEKARILPELKTPGTQIVDRFVKEVRDLGCADWTIAQSFHGDVLGGIRQTMKELPLLALYTHQQLAAGVIGPGIFGRIPADAEYLGVPMLSAVLHGPRLMEEAGTRKLVPWREAKLSENPIFLKQMHHLGVHAVMVDDAGRSLDYYRGKMGIVEGLDVLSSLLQDIVGEQGTMGRRTRPANGRVPLEHGVEQFK